MRDFERGQIQSGPLKEDVERRSGTGLGEWLRRVETQTQGFDKEEALMRAEVGIENLRKELGGEMLEKLMNKVLDTNINLAEDDAEDEIKAVEGLGLTESDFSLFSDVLSASYIGVMDEVWMGAKPVRGGALLEERKKFADDLMLMALSTRVMVRDTEKDIGGPFIQDHLGFVDQLRKVNDGNEASGDVSYTNPQMEASAKIMAWGWEMDVWCRDRLGRLIEGSPELKMAMEGAKAKKERGEAEFDLLETMMGKIEVSGLMTSADRGRNLNSFANNVFISWVERARDLGYMGEQGGEKGTDNLGEEATADGLLSFKKEIGVALTEAGRVVEDLIGALELAKTKQVGLEDIEESFRDLERRATEVLPVVEELKGLLTEAEDGEEVDTKKLWEVLSLADGGLGSEADVRLLVDNWPVLEKVYGVVEGGLVSIKSRIEGLLTAVNSGVGFDDLKSVIIGQVRELVGVLGNERLMAGGDKVARFAKMDDVSEVEITEELKELRTRLKTIS